MPDTLAWYDAHAARLAGDYEALAPASIRPWLADLLPAAPAVIVDVGAGTGRDAARFAADGYDVVAVEPSAGMRAEGQRLHAHPRLKWMADALSGLLSVARCKTACKTFQIPEGSRTTPWCPPAEERGPRRGLPTLEETGL